MSSKNGSSPLGRNPFNSSIFAKTSLPEEPDSSFKKIENSNDILESIKEEPVSSSKSQESPNLDIESSSLEAETIFLNEGPEESINLRLPASLNDWLNGIIVTRRRANKKRIKKERIVQAAIEVLRSLPLDMEAVESEDELKQELVRLLKNLKLES